MSFFHWEEGRVGTGYRKLTLFRGHRFLPFDCYLIDYPIGSSVPTHTDPIPGKRHFRLNILLMGEDVYGGKVSLSRPLAIRSRHFVFNSLSFVEPCART